MLEVSCTFDLVTYEIRLMIHAIYTEEYDEDNNQCYKELNCFMVFA
jgi:hypothetical protein